MSRSVDFADIQGLAAFGYGKLTEASYFLAAIQDVAAARVWLLKAQISTAERKASAPETAIQIGFTAGGLRAMRVPEHLVDAFSPEFCSGLAGETSRSRRLGDVDSNDPAGWLWGGPGRAPDIIVMLFARSNLNRWIEQVQDENWRSAFGNITRLDTSNMDGHEPFGFRDGVSQPEIDWRQEFSPAGDKIKYSNKAAVGEFLLGYVNEYAKYTDRPLVDPAVDSGGDLPAAEDAPQMKDLGRNGTYLVLRQLEQDVRGFWRFLDREAGGDAVQREALGTALVGRALDGTPLIPTLTLNDFTYDSDPKGVVCPYGAHIRRGNPRNADLFGRPGGIVARLSQKLGIPRAGFHDDLMASTRFHRMLRRGREYGPLLKPEDALNAAPAGDPPRGLHFACLNANIARQFEFVQSAWMMSTKFNGLRDENDPLLGAAGNFTIGKAGGLRRLISGMPCFVAVRGGAYFFMPGLGALRFIAKCGKT